MQSKTPAKTQKSSKEIPDQVGNDKKGDPGKTFKANAATKNLFFGIAEPQVIALMQ